MKEEKKLGCHKCRMGIPVGIIVLLIGLTGIILVASDYESYGIVSLIGYIALFLIGMPFTRLAMLVNSAHARIDDLENKITKS